MRILKEGREYAMLTTGLYGRHNIANLLSAVALADFLGISRKEVSTALREFSGVKRRQEIMGEKGGVLVLDDFAHHPTAVKATVEAVREKYRNRRLIAVFEPRSNSSRRRVFQVQYTSAFQGADLIMIPEPPLMEKIPLPDRFSSQRLVADLAAKGCRAHYFPGTDQLLEGILSVSRPGDVVLIMSNGAFDDLHHRLLARL
jgi:UDP-N-acetylmuramate: L-alanyl-gamma-D-glutamyl-meso-diaminopimelate ligase